MSKRDGARAATAEIVESAARENADAVKAAIGAQLDMLPSRFVPGGKAWQRERAAAEREAIARHAAGRPAGAQNKATRDGLEFVRKVFGDPLIERARWLQHTPETLAKALSCTKLEAFDRLEKIRADLTRLYYAPLAQVDGNGNAVAPIFAPVFGAGVPGAPAAGKMPWEYGGVTIEATAKETQQNQALSSPDDAQSHGEQSHGVAK